MLTQYETRPGFMCVCVCVCVRWGGGYFLNGKLLRPDGAAGNFAIARSPLLKIPGSAIGNFQVTICEGIGRSSYLTTCYYTLLVFAFLACFCINKYFILSSKILMSSCID